MANPKESTVPEKGRPAQITARAARWPLGHVFANGTRRHPDGEVEQKFIGDAFLAPERILRGHTTNQLP